MSRYWKICVLGAVLTAGFMGWIYEREAASFPGAASFYPGGGREADVPKSAQVPGPRDRATRSSPSSERLPSPIRFDEAQNLGLLVRAWVNGAGPFTFAIDTGAGSTIISSRIAGQARVSIAPSLRRTKISGLSGSVTVTGDEARIESLAIGSPANLLPGRSPVLVMDNLPRGVDGLLDPTESFSPLGYTIDFPRRELRAFDPRQSPLTLKDDPPGGATVQWVAERGGRRPFVLLGDGRHALVDTGSEFGLAMIDQAVPRSTAKDDGDGYDDTRDVAGGRFGVRRVAPITVNVGALVLEKIPTQIISGGDADTPVILGREALRPFEIVFDPVHHLIQFTPR